MDNFEKADLVDLLKHYRKVCKASKEKEKALCEKILSSFKPAELIALKKNNRKCADCSSPDPKWCSSNIGVFVCIKCSGVHRSLGVHISKVLSVVIDDWDQAGLDTISKKGNKKVNAVYEHKIPDNYSKPTPDAEMPARKKYIYSKYVRRRFTQDYVDDGLDAQYDINSPLEIFSAEARKSTALVEYIGVLSVKLIGGTNLVAKDLNGKSDPFVVFKLGDQKFKSTTKNCTLQPVWDERFQLCVKDRNEKLIGKVYDYDVGKRNDDLGEFVIELSSLEVDKPVYRCCKLAEIETGEIHLELTFTSLS